MREDTHHGGQKEIKIFYESKEVMLKSLGARLHVPK
jgi:hypothetical protein